MDKDKIDDIYISKLVQSVEHIEPEMPFLSELKKHNKVGNSNITYLLRTIAATLILLIGTLFINNPGKTINDVPGVQQTANEISEIRTDFVLREDNIKIIWIQKKKFDLNKT